ncbi:MAG: RNA-directed DNA polymerase [Labilithrix sp.]|nr:RNA-directed DNA polymerase [Labilithrix sp.]
MSPTIVADALAAAFLDGAWSAPALARRGARALGQSTRWLPALARRVVAAFPDGAPRDRFEALATLLARDAAVRKAGRPDAPWRLVITAPTLAMRDAHPEWRLPRLHTAGDLATWLGLEIGDLLWFADTRGLSRRRRAVALDHYHRRWLPKRSGGARLVEAPKRWLKEVQRRILRELVERIPPHEAAHGFRRRRGVLSHAALHAGRDVVLRMDLEDFFVSIPASRVFAVFHAAGYPLEVARLLTGLCTTRAPSDPGAPMPATPTRAELEARHRARERYAERHLPQGAPTSPALANLCAWRLDVRLSAAARTAGAVYTRYADDLVFSGDDRFARWPAARFAYVVGGIAIEEGFNVQHRKTKLMRAGTRQQVTGLVVNRSAAIPRRDFERYKAILHNCVLTGPDRQNRDGRPDFRAHLEGVVAWVTHVQPARGAKLAKLLDAIRW